MHWVNLNATYGTYEVKVDEDCIDSTDCVESSFIYRFKTLSYDSFNPLMHNVPKWSDTL